MKGVHRAVRWRAYLGMNNNSIAVTGLGVGIIMLALLGLSIVRPALALVDASSSPSGADDTSTASTTTSSAAVVDSTPTTSAAASSSAVSTNSPEQASPPAAAQTPPPDLKEVHIIGTKYVDYFTDGTTVTSYPGDPEIDAHLAERNALIPTHEGLTWTHTSGLNLYDTPSGDLEVGDYAVQADGSYIENAPPFVSSTSTSAQVQTENATAPSTVSTTSDAADTHAQDASTSEVAPGGSASTSESSQAAGSGD